MRLVRLDDTVKKSRMYYMAREDKMTIQSVSVHRDVPLKEGKALVRQEGRFEEKLRRSGKRNKFSSQ
jgi:hypothetical protein